MSWEVFEQNGGRIIIHGKMPEPGDVLRGDRHMGDFRVSGTMRSSAHPSYLLFERIVLYNTPRPPVLEKYLVRYGPQVDGWRAGIYDLPPSAIGHPRGLQIGSTFINRFNQYLVYREGTWSLDIDGQSASSHYDLPEDRRMGGYAGGVRLVGDEPTRLVDRIARELSHLPALPPSTYYQLVIGREGYDTLVRDVALSMSATQRSVVLGLPVILDHSISDNSFTIRLYTDGGFAVPSVPSSRSYSPSRFDLETFAESTLSPFIDRFNQNLIRVTAEALLGRSISAEAFTEGTLPKTDDFGNVSEPPLEKRARFKVPRTKAVRKKLSPKRRINHR